MTMTAQGTQSTPLTDDQMRGFIRDGFVVVKPGLDEALHQEVWDRTDALFEEEGNPGNNLIARVPAIQRVFDDPAVTGALTGILGPNYFMHPHRHCHYRPPRSPGQTIHKDSFTKRRHRTRWVLAFYYPQTTTVDMGPTGVIPGSHYYNWLRGPIGIRRHVDGLDGEVPLEVEAGTVVLVHYDIWHRGMPNDSDKKRYMIKIMFTRIEEPTAPSWSNDDAGGLGRSRRAARGRLEVDVGLVQGRAERERRGGNRQQRDRPHGRGAAPRRRGSVPEGRIRHRGVRRGRRAHARGRHA